MSIFSMMSPSPAPLATVSRNGYRPATTRSKGSRSCSVSCRTWSGLPRSARSPAWILGWSVFTRPSSISGNPVTSSTGVTGRPAPASTFAVPPEETRATPSSTSAEANPTSPVLSKGANRARRTGRTSSTGRLLEDVHAPPLDAQPAFGHRAQRGGEQPMLDLVDPRLEGIPVVVRQHRNGFLRDDGAVVHLLVDQVDGDARDLGTPRERVRDGLRPREGRQQRGMH